MLNDLNQRVRSEVDKVVRGQGHVVDVMLAATVIGGHVLLEGPPGVAKTLTANAFARALGLDFRRVQFTPDMLPSDITGTITLVNSGATNELGFRRGPIFTNVLLADEINRTPPKTQSALLEAMQESQVTVDGTRHELPQPFVVIATQNPIEYEGTYPLPEAQLDRFLAKIDVGYPSAADESALLQLAHNGLAPATLTDVQAVTNAAEILAARAAVDGATVSIGIVDYVAAIVRRTRELPSVLLGASPRAGVHLLTASKAIAALAGRSFVIPEDVQAAAPTVLQHRILLRPEAELERFTAAEVMRSTLAAIPVPR